MKWDVLVLGGGSAGLAAATTAARRGTRTLLAERHGALGGMGTASLVHTFCGLYHLDGERAEIANPGWCGEIAARMECATGLGPKKMGRVWVLPQHPTEFAVLADRLVTESGVETRFHTEVIGLAPRAEGGWIARLACRGGIENVEAAAVIDASGDAVAAALLGTADRRTPAARLQRPAYVCAFGGVANGEIDGLQLSARLVEGVRLGELPAAALGMHFRASGRPGEIFGTLDLSGEETGPYDPADPACLADLEFTGRRVCGAILAYLRARQRGWEHALVAAWPARAGVRESRAWIGRARLTGDELLRGARFDDEVALATWPMEMRETHRGPKLRFPESGRPAGIRADALRARDFDRLYVAGRCISCDHDAQASIRVMGTCFATGEAAGLMAARAADGKSDCQSILAQPQSPSDR
jgi:hypothetical protein